MHLTSVLVAVLCHPYDYLKLFICNPPLVKNNHSGSVSEAAESPGTLHFKHIAQLRSFADQAEFGRPAPTTNLCAFASLRLRVKPPLFFVPFDVSSSQTRPTPAPLRATGPISSLSRTYPARPTAHQLSRIRPIRPIRPTPASTPPSTPFSPMTNSPSAALKKSTSTTPPPTPPLPC